MTKKRFELVAFLILTFTFFYVPVKQCTDYGVNRGCVPNNWQMIYALGDTLDEIDFYRLGIQVLVVGFLLFGWWRFKFSK